MNPGLITALAAIFGSLVGALGSAFGTSIVQKHQDRRDVVGKKIVRREALYSDFIAESARFLVDALQHNVGDPQKLIPVYALLSRIRLSSSSRVLGTAEEVIKTILNAYDREKPPRRYRTASVSFLFSGARFTVSGSTRLRSVRRAVEYGAIRSRHLDLQDFFISLRLLPIICHLLVV